MKDLVKRVKSFIIFDFPLQTAYISTQFNNVHRKLQSETSGWSTVATRQKLISRYWFTYVPGHFAFVLGFPALLIFLLFGFKQAGFYLPGVFIAGLISYTILYLFHYRPYFSSVFLPRLETIKEVYECSTAHKQEKCRQAQLSNLSLTLIFYVLDKSSGMNAIQCNDQFARHLMKLYGVDSGSMKKNLELLCGKKKPLSIRKITEVQKNFQEAFSFFEFMGFSEGVAELRKLERRLLQ
jgi:hypothetical protein